MTWGETDAERRSAVIGIIRGLLKKLSLLAPDPSRLGYKGPVFIQSNPVYNTVQDHDALAGQIFFEIYLTPTFADAVSAVPYCPDNIGKLDNFAGAASEYLADRDDQEDTHEGRGSLATCKQRAITNGFNFHATMSSAQTAMVAAFRSDLPRRLALEKSIAYYTSRLLEPAIS